MKKAEVQEVHYFKWLCPHCEAGWRTLMERPEKAQVCMNCEKEYELIVEHLVSRSEVDQQILDGNIS